MEANLKGNMSKVKSKGLESTCGQMAPDIKANGTIIRSMGLVDMIGLMDDRSMGNG